MEARLIFGNVEFMQTDGQTVRVRVGQPAFTMTLYDTPLDLQWASTKDQVLEVVEKSTVSVEITAKNKGQSYVILLGSAFQPKFRLMFDVFDPEEAAAFDVPAPKTEPIT